MLEESDYELIPSYILVIRLKLCDHCPYEYQKLIHLLSLLKPLKRFRPLVRIYPDCAFPQIMLRSREFKPAFEHFFLQLCEPCLEMCLDLISGLKLNQVLKIVVDNKLGLLHILREMNYL